MPIHPFLDELVVRLERLHPSDAAAVVGQLSSAHRQVVLDQIARGRADQTRVAREALTATTTVSAWLVAASHADSPLTSRARTALAQHILAGRALSPPPPSQTLLGLSAIARAWRSWLVAEPIA